MKLASQTPFDFVKHFLVQSLRVRWVVVGEKFRFGRNREGDVECLKKIGCQMGFQVKAIPSFKIHNQIVSSSIIRSSLSKGQVDFVFECLGRPYSFIGQIFTCNQKREKNGYFVFKVKALHHVFHLKEGMYEVDVILSSKKWSCILSRGNYEASKNSSSMYLYMREDMRAKANGKEEEVRIVLKKIIK